MAEKIKLGYGAHPLEITPPENLLQLLEPNPMPACPDPTAELERALSEPINAPAPEELYKPGMKVCIVVADKTRIFPKTEMIRTLIRHLPSIPDQDLTIVIGGGNHLYAPPEAHGIDPQLINRYQVLVHQSLPQDDFIEVGKSQRGTPFKLNPAVAKADLIFGLGQVKPHYFAGYAGGAKAIVPGVSALETIIKNHLLQADPRAELGRIKDNPFRQDLDEIINFLPNFYIYNLVMNREGELVRAFYGHPASAYQPALELARKIAQVPAKTAPLVIVSAPLPLSIDIYQITKLVAPAGKVCQENGVIIVCAQAPDGLVQVGAIMNIIWPMGLPKFLKKNIDIYLVSDARKEEVEQTFFKYAPSFEFALEQALKKLGPEPETIIIPDAGMLAPITSQDQPETW